MHPTLDRLTAAAILAGSLSACALLQTALERVGDAVNDYCRNTLSDRQALRAILHQRTAPHTLTIDCAGDPPTAPRT